MAYAAAPPVAPCCDFEPPPRSQLRRVASLPKCSAEHGAQIRMEIHINTGNGMDNKETLESWADGEIRRTLGRFSNDVRRVEVHLSDENSGTKGGADDKRCVIEAHVTSLPPVAVSHQASSLDEAFRGAEAKARRALDTVIGKLNERRDHTSIRTQQPEGL